MEQENQTCTLSGPELAARLREWAEVASQATSRRVEPRRVVATYPRDDELLRRVKELVAAEARCCSFMRFTIEEGREEFEVELRVPDGMEEALSGMRGLISRPVQTVPA